MRRTTVSGWKSVHPTCADCVLGLGVNFDEPVVTHIGSTIHYELASEAGVEQWSKLVPESGHLVYLPSNDGSAAPYTVALFHQMKCLNILRGEYISRIADRSKSPSTTASNCLNYLRQSILCNVNMALERNKQGNGKVAGVYDMKCNDWGKVYEEAAMYSTRRERT
jgi:hypothetical protein